MVTNNLAEDRCFKALADNTRRDIVRSLADEAMPVHALAQRFSISRPAVSRHLRILRQAGLVDAKDAGRENVYYLKTAPLEALEKWLNDLWKQRLSKLKALAEGVTDE